MGARRRPEEEGRGNRQPVGDGRTPLARMMADLGPYLELGWVFVFSLLAGLGVGWWLDGRFGTRPWLMVVGLLLGMAAGFVNLVKVTLRKPNATEDKR